MARFAMVVPEMGGAIEVACILSWYASVGDWVEKDAPVMALSTDKADIEVPAPFAGRLVQILHPAGTTLRCGEVAAILESEW
jgi:pyruvate/2-oxoglutarate dehydrogenase complex dihydrolipoamide acyltransferase (E2) component